MKLLVNTASSFAGGSIQTSNSFINECKKFDQHEYHVILGVSLAKIFDKSTFPDNFTFYEIDYRPATRLFSLSRTDEFMRKVEEEVQPDCVYSVGGPAYWVPKAPHVMGFTLGYFIYPESPYFDTFSFTQKIKWKLRSFAMHHFVSRDADAYVVQTDDVNQRLRKWIGAEKVFTVSNAFGSYFLDPPTNFESKLPEREEGEQRLLLVSIYYVHKNFEIINEVSEILDRKGDEKIRFVLTLPSADFERVFTESAKRRIHNVGPVKPQECPGLYHECDFVFLPTFVECFSANYVEGMITERPILTSDMSFAHTVCSDAAVYFDPLNAQDVTEKILKLTSSPALKQDLIEKGKKRLTAFNTAESRAESVLKICESMIESK